MHRQQRDDDHSSRKENNMHHIQGHNGYPQRKMDVSKVGKRALFDEIQNLDEPQPAPKAPKKVKVEMKSSKRRKIFGSIRKKKPLQKVILSESYSGESAAFVTRSFENEEAVHVKKEKETKKSNATKTPTRSQSVLEYQETRMHSNAAYNVASRNEIFQLDRYTSSQTDEMTEVSVLTMTSPQQEAFVKAQRELQKKATSAEEHPEVQQSTSMFGSFFCASKDFFPLSTSESEFVNSIVPDHSTDEFSIECENRLHALSSLSDSSDGSPGTSQESSQDCSSLGSASTPAPHSMASSKAKSNSSRLATAKNRFLNGIQAMIADCVAPVSNSPCAKRYEF